jgi:hypothetical protein
MMGARRLAALTCALVALLPASVAAASRVAHYSGKTSQRAAISFTVSGGHVRQLRFTIYIKCPSRHIWRIKASSFPPIKITHGSFDERFIARGNKGSARVRGHLSARRVRGTLFDRTYEPTEHHFCAGTARYDLGRAHEPKAVPRARRAEGPEGHGD